MMLSPNNPSALDTLYGMVNEVEEILLNQDIQQSRLYKMMDTVKELNLSDQETRNYQSRIWESVDAIRKSMPPLDRLFRQLRKLEKELDFQETPPMPPKP